LRRLDAALKRRSSTVIAALEALRRPKTLRDPKPLRHPKNRCATAA
jgi:hypothetical protein